MHQNDMQSFYQQIYAHINWQAEKINELEQKIQQLQNRDTERQEAPTHQLEQRIQQLQREFAQQQIPIYQLEQTLQQLQHEVNQLKNQRPVIVEKMEYKFDQLKVEKLEGTLNIGVTPQSLGNIDELAIHDTTAEDVPIQPPPSRLFQQIKNQVGHYINRELPKEIHALERKYRYKLHQEAREFIVEDINQQMDNRIHYYLNDTNSDSVTGNRESTKDIIVKKVKRDVRTAVENYISKLSKEGNGIS
ncbi:spore germination protein GerPC [Aneurinibacillus sp. Ricciae_BoGa-3]|uniref:spore germination protein GerPC n=1 Tax=Aneurinibacillus sp. Ricciae_BoGa-3 TaxID=3022697 RepID=UPI002340F83F|nr:spore germination protein GerPC [Aneurinibacillus sp. Ricciae_BoGa-3]WCK55205.1 spore germination protein GerPC [Aneurinibacillus sp. Ricciae_BoGa-3]